MKFLRLILSLGEAYTDATYTDAAKIMIPYMDQIMNHDYIGSFGCIPNEPKTSRFCLIIESQLLRHSGKSKVGLYE